MLFVPYVDLLRMFRGLAYTLNRQMHARDLCKKKTLPFTFKLDREENVFSLHSITGRKTCENCTFETANIRPIYILALIKGY